MRKLLSFIVVTAVLATLPASGADFRKNSWGDTVEQVISVEGEPVSRPEGSEMSFLRYDGSLAGVPCAIMYMFKYNKLWFGNYITLEFNLIDFEKWRSVLIAKYGPGDVTPGGGLCWLTPTTFILFGAVISDDQPAMAINYSDKNYR